MTAHTEALVIFLIWEWYLGSQDWTKAKSTIALVLLILSAAGIAIAGVLQKKD